MSEHEQIFFVVEDMVEIARTQYYSARKNDRLMLMNEPFGFVIGRGDKRIMYLTAHSGKFYMGELKPEQNLNELKNYKFIGVMVKKPYGMFRRTAHNPVVETPMEEKVS